MGASLGARIERAVLVGAPFLSMAAVGAGLRLGAPDTVTGALVYSSPPARAALRLAWQVDVFRVRGESREPLANRPLQISVGTDGTTVRLEGSTGDDGVAEVELPLPTSDIVHLEIRSGPELLASGDARVPPRVRENPTSPVWMPFARREGAIALDVAVLGQRVAPGFPSTLFVRARDAATHAPLVGVAIEPVSDSSWVFARSSASTSTRGWAELTGTASGLALSLAVEARAHGERTGVWQGGLFAAPGAVQIRTRRRWSPAETPAFEIVAPSSRPVEYLEIDDALGRAWATIVSLRTANDQTASADVTAPSLPSGLYWAVAASSPGGATSLDPPTAATPFFVAESDARALAYGLDSGECLETADPSVAAAAIGPCLALSPAAPVARWTALDGFAQRRALLRGQRARGIALAIGAVLLAVVLEGILVLRAAARGRRRIRAIDASEIDVSDRETSLPVRVVLSVLVALLGFALVAAMVLRWA